MINSKRHPQLGYTYPVLHSNYIKCIDPGDKPHFPVILTGNPHLQQTIAYKYVNRSFYYELEFVAGETLEAKCKKFAQVDQLENLLLEFFTWYKKNFIFRFCDEILMINADSNPSNIICSANGFVHIDNQTDFLRVTRDEVRPYLPLRRLLQEHGLCREEFLQRAQLPLELMDSCWDNADFTSEQNDQLIAADRDHFYRNYFRFRHSSSDLLYGLLIEQDLKMYAQMLPITSGIIRADYASALSFYERFSGEI